MEDITHNQEININPTDQPPGTGVNLNLSEIEVLRDRLEQQKANKLKAEQLVSTLSKIKAREKATRRSTKTGDKKIDDGVSNQPTKRSGTNSSNALKEKSNLLKKKLEEDRAKFESKRGQEDLGKVSQIVEHIRVQLEDQDKTIQQIHSNFAATTRVPQSAVEEAVPAEPDLPPEVKQRIADLELRILDLQENLREKDSVISARTQAITLLSEDMARKGKNTLDTLEETRSQMKTMQANFVALEDRMNEERSRLKEELEVKKNRLQQIEKNYRAAESARFDLSTRVAELQEKVVLLQTKNLTLEEEVAETSSKTKELNEALETSNKQMIKMKAQFKAKLKAVEEERDMLRKEERTNEELNRLRERIADLEDEKEAGHLLKERIAEMEEKLHRQECDLDSHIKAITSLEAEKLDMIEMARKNDVVLSEKENLMIILHSQIAQLEESKITAEMKCLELEEKLDSYLKTEDRVSDLTLELENAKQRLLEHQDTISELTMKLESKGSLLTGNGDQTDELEGTNESKNMQDVASSLAEWQNRYSLLEEKLNTTLAYCEQLEGKKKTIEVENERLLIECENLRCTVDNLNHILNQKSDSSDNEIVLLRQTVAQKETEISNLSKHNKTLETEVDNLRHALQSTTEELHILSQQIEQLNCTQQKVEELNVTLDSKDKELEQTTSELEIRSRKLSEYKKFHKLKSEDVIRISQELENVTVSSQQRISDLEKALNMAQKNEEELRKEVQILKESDNKGPESGDTKMQEQQTVKMKKLAASVKLKAKLIKDLEAKIDELEKSLQQKEIFISGIESEKENSQKEVIEKSLHETRDVLNTNELEEKCKTLENELKTLKENVKLKSDELECFKNDSTESHEALLHIKELENQNQKLSDNLVIKSDQLNKVDDEIFQLNSLNRSLLAELEQMQETYKQDALKNESVLNSFEHEMLGNKKDILELSNQLKDVTIKYEQTWAKLQEKEGYIEDLEQQLDKAKNRLLQIENTVEDRRRSLEEKAEMLGARLCHIEKNNEELEKHEDELEQKIAYLLNTEEMLGKVIQKLQEENIETSKMLNETADANVQLSQELDNERNKAQFLVKEVNDLKLNLTNYEMTAENNEALKVQLKECQESHEKKVKYLETRLLESENCVEGEVQRLLDKIAVVEAERQEAVDNYNSLFIEKQTLEEENADLQQTISDVTKEELAQLKINHEILTEQMNKELEKRQDHIQRIKELESQLLKQTAIPDYPPTVCNDEVLELKNQLDKEIKEKEGLQYELLKEKAINQVNSVITKAKETYFTMTGPETEIENKSSLFTDLGSTASGGNSEPVLLNKSEENQTNKISELETKLAILTSENTSLISRLQELEQWGQNLPENSGCLPDSEDWAAVSKDEDDGWGWGSKDAMLEHEHIQKQNINSELEGKIVELERRLSSLQEENTRVTEELKASQAKCTKLLKKVKEFKNKSDCLERNSREKSLGFDDLDIAMQDELKSQVEKLEKSLRECSLNLNTLQQEREGFLKRIDTLTSGNERLVEMKERQDIEVEMWQRRSNELQNKVQGLEWTVAELQVETKDLGDNSTFTLEDKQQFLSNALEMEEKLNALAAENDYLQLLIVDLKEEGKKTTLQTNESPKTNEDFKQQMISEVEFLNLKHENERLNILVQTLEEKMNNDSKVTSDELTECSHKISTLIKENEMLSMKIAQLNAQRESKLDSQGNIQSLKDNIAESKIKHDTAVPKMSIFAFDSDQLEKENANLIESKDNVVDISKTSRTEESPTLFRGFEVSSDNLTKSLFDTQVVNNPSGSHLSSPASSSRRPVDFFDSINIEPDLTVFEDKQAQLQNIPLLATGTVDGIKESVTNEYLQEISNLKTLLSEKECEFHSLKDTFITLEDDNNYLKQQIEKQAYQTPGTWGPPGKLSKEYGSDSSFQWGIEIDFLKKLEEKDEIITDLREKLNSESTHLPGYTKEQGEESSSISKDGFHDLFSQAENIQESTINMYVEQITELTKLLHDKEVEIETLIDKKKKYKEMYYAIAKECDPQPSDQSNVDNQQLTDQNTLLNQLLEDKETELEIMSQQIDQTKVAKDNLQDELSLKLCEMEAANNTFTIPQQHKQILLRSLQPENIEEVRTLCSEVTELSKLLQEKESEVEILKQQLDELTLEKENLLDEWKREIELYKERSNRDAAKAQEIEKELENIKNIIVADIEKQYKDELSLKDQQLMNVMNDLHNTHSVCQDLQEKINDLENNLKICNSKNGLLLKEINDLKHEQNSIQLLTQEICFGTEMNLSEKVKKLKDDLLDMEIKFEEAKSKFVEKDEIILDLKEKVKEFETNLRFDDKVVVEQPLTPVQMKTFASEPFRISTEQSSSDDDSSSKHMETIQGQMVLMKEIQSLKQVLSMKDTEITRLSIALNDAHENLIRGEMRFINSEEESLRHRLDEALYTLHSRDVRCDELALELTQLLEERDSLQLRLSTAIRLNEELRQKSKLLDEAAFKLEGIDSSFTTEDDRGNNEQLRLKLDQLHNVGYRRDPGLQQDQQRRHNEQMQLFTPHIPQDESQNSSGFFNWIFGPSPSGSQDV